MDYREALIKIVNDFKYLNRKMQLYRSLQFYKKYENNILKKKRCSSEKGPHPVLEITMAK